MKKFLVCVVFSNYFARWYPVQCDTDGDAVEIAESWAAAKNPELEIQSTNAVLLNDVLAKGPYLRTYKNQLEHEAEIKSRLQDQNAK